MNPEISVIIPTYNHARFLPDALRSVQAQTFENWEAIVVDDGSTDNTPELAASFIDPRIHYIRQENRGLSAARNTGIRTAKGRFIALLDADDMWEPTFLERTLQVFNTEPTAHAAYSGFQYMRADGTLLPQSVMRVVPPEQFRAQILTHGNWLSACAVVVLAAVYREVGPFDESLGACEDLDMWLRIAEHHTFVGIADILVLYRRCDSSMSSNADLMRQARIVVAEKHLGSLTTALRGWSPAKLAFATQLHSGYVQRCVAQGQPKKTVESLQWLVQNRPNLVVSQDFWYSIACVHQLVGERGDFSTWQPDRGQRDVGNVLDALFMGGEVSKQEAQTLRGQAYLALARLNYGKGEFSTARRLLRLAVQCCPDILKTATGRALTVRLLPGVSRLRSALSSKAPWGG